MKYAICAGISAMALIASWGHGALWGLKRSEIALEPYLKRIEYLELSGPCEPVYAASWCAAEPRLALAWPPLKLDIEVQGYRDTDASKVLARLREVGMRPGLRWSEQRGRKERVAKIVWNPAIE